MPLRPSGRAADALRAVRVTRGYTRHAAGSVLIEYGDTRVLCTASVDTGVPAFMRGAGRGWITAEYGMLPAATHTRSDREAARGQQSGRTQEIQRLIGRSLRTAVDMGKLGENTVRIDCDVLQADGGTRTAAITGSCIALVDALAVLKTRGLSKGEPLRHLVAAVSVGIYQGRVVLDLDYAEDSAADTDLNLVMTEGGGIVEVQGTAEGEPFAIGQLEEMLRLGAQGIDQLVRAQREALGWQ